MNCRFGVATFVGSHIVSTVGEYLPCDAKVFKVIGVTGLYETMVFEVADRNSDYGCGLPEWKGLEVDADRCDTATEANTMHLRLCSKWAT